MNSLEIRSAISVAMIFFCRMMGLFMVLPVLSLYGQDLDDATPMLLGLAVGLYGLSQASLQIPFAILSDAFGRKRIILFGLLLFFIGSVASIYVDSIWALLVCRFLQGSGAIAGTSMAFLADSSSKEARTRVMAIVGIAIGASFVLALVAGPFLAGRGGLTAVFEVSAVLAGLALFIAYFFIQESNPPSFLQSWYAFKQLKYKAVFQDFFQVLKLDGVLAYSISVFILHSVMTACFIAVPLLLEDSFEITRESHWKFYLSVFLVSIVLMGPFARPSASEEKLTIIYRISAALLFICLVALGASSQVFYLFSFFLCLFFTAFNLLEALLPSMLSLAVSEQVRARAMGVFSMFQFMGAFTGSLFAGVTLQLFDVNQVFFVSAFLFLLVGVSITLGIRTVQYHRS